MLASVSTLSGWTRIDRRQITQRLASLKSEPGPHRSKLYPSETALRLIYATDGNLDPQQQRARLDCARADLAELDLAQKRGNLLDASVVSETWSHQVLIAKGRLLAIPNRLAPIVVGMGDMREIELAIRDEIYSALTELSTDESPTDTAD